MPDLAELALTDPDGHEVPFAAVVWTAPDSTGVSAPDWQATARRRAEQQNAQEVRI